MIKFEVKHRITGEVKFKAEIDCDKNEKLSVKLGLAVKWGVENNADLRYADLSYADLRYANLRSTNLRYADLRSTNLSYADLSSTDLSYADLSYADLRSANLRSTNLRYADLSYADLRYADLSYADLRSANLRSANLSYADLRSANLLIFQGFGTDARTLYAHKCKGGGVIQIRTGCFFGTIEEFKKAVKEKHSNNNHGKDYKMLCEIIEQKFNNSEQKGGV